MAASWHTKFYYKITLQNPKLIQKHVFNITNLFSLSDTNSVLRPFKLNRRFRTLRFNTIFLLLANNMKRTTATTLSAQRYQLKRTFVQIKKNPKKLKTKKLWTWDFQNLLFRLRRSTISCYIIWMTVLLNLEVTTLFSLAKKN